MNWKRFAAFTFALLAALLLSYQPARRAVQRASRNIQGVVTDPQGGVVPNAKITITNKDTGAVTRHDDNVGRHFHIWFARAGKLYGSGRSAELQDRVRRRTWCRSTRCRARTIKLELGCVEHGGGSERSSNRGEYGSGAGVRQLDHTADRKFARSTAATSSTWRNSSPAFRFRTAATSIPRRLVSPRFHSADALAAARASQWTAWT